MPAASNGERPVQHEHGAPGRETSHTGNYAAHEGFVQDRVRREGLDRRR
jgi:hypothetical protein